MEIRLFACSSGKRQYTYKVFIETLWMVTLWLSSDCGFDVYSKQRLGLAHINAAEADRAGAEGVGISQEDIGTCTLVCDPSLGQEKYGRIYRSLLFSAIPRNVS